MTLPGGAAPPGISFWHPAFMPALTPSRHAAASMAPASGDHRNGIEESASFERADANIMGSTTQT
jgi:hypothetical protein